jgi:hypothetical protein
MVAGVSLRDGAQFLPVVRELHGFAVGAVDARPDDMTMLAAVLDVKDNRAGLRREAE